MSGKVWYPNEAECTTGCNMRRYGTHQTGCPSEPHDPPRSRCVCAEYGGRGSWAQHRPQCIARFVAAGSGVSPNPKGADE